MKSMNLEKISNLMDKFEQQFEDLDVQSGVMENAMSQNVTTMVPQNDVDSLMQQVADEAGYALLKPKYVHVFLCCHCLRLELNMELPEGVTNTAVGTTTTTQMSQEQDELSQRLARLRETE